MDHDLAEVSMCQNPPGLLQAFPISGLFADHYKLDLKSSQIHQIHDCDEDKALRKSIFNHIVRDIAHMNQKTKNQKDPSSALREGQSSRA